MTAITDTIIAELVNAFPAIRPARFPLLVNSVSGDEPRAVQTDFADKDDWTKLRSEWLDTSPNGLGTALCFLSDEAIRFYIPAYLVADLIGSLRCVDPVDTLVHGLESTSHDQKIWPRKDATWTESAHARWGGLTQLQAMAIVHYLEWRAGRDTLGVDRGISEALTCYWYGRAAIGQ
ncbi:hypothetical protein FHS95_002499 [Sphingomonas naasensis]|uniref:Uncharacterized protein n=1 Tax=Sphingomonas naasensis TaxID=1344951 RepID=A0A4S1WJ44_9SPHN|nr:DUF6714 family protein [Sphingomonas naasensis]NIJ20807.1 hypothetical protein [Sphingomonas naasensis]TGX43211.1 hypothetical protein E5A74_08545 [Sphingomonas naasensis]